MSIADDLKQIILSNLSFSELTLEWLPRIVDLESNGFPPDEAASEATMKFRLINAPSFFIGTFLNLTNPRLIEFLKKQQNDLLVQDKILIGYVAGTCSKNDRLEHESMFNHDSSGSHLCIHSVLTDPIFQGLGIAKLSLLNYIKHIQHDERHISKISLLAKESTMALYEKCGFKYLGASQVVHGQDVWQELSISLE